MTTMKTIEQANVRAILTLDKSGVSPARARFLFARYTEEVTNPVAGALSWAMRNLTARLRYSEKVHE